MNWYSSYCLIQEFSRVNSLIQTTAILRVSKKTVLKVSVYRKSLQLRSLHLRNKMFRNCDRVKSRYSLVQ